MDAVPQLLRMSKESGGEQGTLHSQGDVHSQEALELCLWLETVPSVTQVDELLGSHLEKPLVISSGLGSAEAKGGSGVASWVFVKKWQLRL